MDTYLEKRGGMGALPLRGVQYVIWQNRATRFYVGARSLYLAELYAPASYCAVIALELLLKATLVYHDKSFDPIAARHNGNKLMRMIGNKVAGGKKVSVPAYFFADERFLVVSRYPTDGKGVGIPGSFLLDLDRIFANLVYLTPFQHNTELVRILTGQRSAASRVVVRHNDQSRQLRTFLRKFNPPLER